MNRIGISPYTLDDGMTSCALIFADLFFGSKGFQANKNHSTHIETECNGIELSA